MKFHDAYLLNSYMVLLYLQYIFSLNLLCYIINKVATVADVIFSIRLHTKSLKINNIAIVSQLRTD